MRLCGVLQQRKKKIKGFVMIGMSLSLLAICAIMVSTLFLLKMIARD